MAELIPTKELLRRNVAKNAAKTVLTDEEKKAVRAGASRAWYADLPGSVADISGAALDYGAEGLARLLPSDLAGYDIPKSLGIRKFQQAMRNPALGSKQLEKFGEEVGYIPPTTGTETEERARLLAGFVDPVPGVPIGSVKQTKVFSSPAVKAVSEIKQNKMPANQWISQMKSRGVKQDEMTWTGVEDWLKSQDKSVTKQDLDEYLEANQIQVQEVVKGTADPKAKELVINNEIADELTSIMDNDEGLYNMRDEIVPFIDKYRSGDETVVNDLDQYFMEYGDLDTGELAIPVLRNKYEHYFEQNPREFERLAGGETKYGQYTLPGGENYRELLLTLPSRRPLITKDPGGRYEELMDISARRDLTDAEQAEMLAIERQQFNQESGAVGQDFVSGHYDDPNIIAHIRFNERVDADGNKVLFIEEIQSDWAQKGRKSGFLSSKQEEVQKLIDEKGDIVKRAERGMNDSGGTYMKIRSEDLDRYNEIERILDDTLPDDFPGSVGGLPRVPQAPFVMDTNQWTSLALKRMVRWATDNDFDQIAWTTGKQQAKRYDLSKQVDQISYKKNEDGTYVLLITPKGSNAALDTIQNQNMKSVPENKLEDIIGKELAKKIVNKEGEAFTNLSYMNEAKTQEDMTFRKFTGVDLEVGGEGMGAFYDKILVDRAKKLGKQYGSKVEKGEIVTDDFQYEIKESPGEYRVHYPGRDGGTEVNVFPTREQAESFALSFPVSEQGTEVWTMNLTDKLKKAAKDGLPYYVALPPIVAGVASQQAEASEVKKPAVQVKSKRIMEEAMP